MATFSDEEISRLADAIELEDLRAELAPYRDRARRLRRDAREAIRRLRDHRLDTAVPVAARPGLLAALTDAARDD